MKPGFSALDRPPGVRVRDPIENAQFELYTDASVDPVPADTEPFALPAERAVAFTARRLELPQLLNVSVWTQDGTLHDQSANQDTDEYPARDHSLDVDIGPMKLQVAASAPVTVRREENTTFLAFPEPTRIRLGARSLHESPAATITVTDDVADGMRAVSLFGSALKTTSPERSFPTLRGHPPLVERGDEFAAPDHLEPADTNVTIEIPRDWGDLYCVASLAYYLGADVRPGPERALVLDGERHELGTDRPFEAEATTLLKHVFFLDCVVRTEGLYPVDLTERAAVADDIDFDLAAAYEASPADRLSAYLDVPYEVTTPHVPRWKITADVAPESGRIESLPFVVNDLAAVRIPGRNEADLDVHDEPEAVTEFFRGDGGLVRSASDRAHGELDVVKPDQTTAIEHAWLADGFPLGASKAAAKYYRRRFDYDTPEQDSIRIDIVCNDPTMADEDVVEEFYGARDFFEFQIAVHYDLSRRELADLLERDIDFLHYIGHVEEGGFECEDGLLDANTLDRTGVRAFLLNACRSYQQGKALVERGSVGGIVTLTNISNDPAVRIGRALARLLNNGFSLLSGLSVARNVTLFGNQYITIGDGTLQLVQHATGTPLLLEVDSLTDDPVLDIYGFPTSRTSIGSLYMPHIADQREYYLNSGHIDQFDVTTSELREFFQLNVMPVMLDGDLVWTDELLDGGFE